MWALAHAHAMWIKSAFLKAYVSLSTLKYNRASLPNVRYGFVSCDFRYLHNIVLFLAENYINITVYTADLQLAGTTSRVYINIYGMLYGLEESTAKLHLTNHNDKEFSRGRWDLMIH